MQYKFITGLFIKFEFGYSASVNDDYTYKIN